MEKITFVQNDTGEGTDFFVLEETRLNGIDYILVADSEEEDAEAMILKDLSADGSQEAVYEVVEDGRELEAVMSVFEQLLEDVDITF